MAEDCRKSRGFYYHKILKKDPLGMILERFNVAEERDELIFLDLNRWFGKKPVLSRH